MATYNGYIYIYIYAYIYIYMQLCTSMVLCVFNCVCVCVLDVAYIVDGGLDCHFLCIPCAKGWESLAPKVIKIPARIGSQIHGGL